MNRRGFLGMLAALPLVGRVLAEEPKPIVKTVRTRWGVVYGDPKAVDDAIQRLQIQYFKNGTFPGIPIVVRK